jgi:hypothetical protein
MAKTFWAELCCAALILVAAGCSSAPSDAVIAADARNRIGADKGVQANQVHVSSNRGILSLTGTVVSDSERQAAAGDAAQASGIRVLVNNLRVANAPAPVETAQAPKPSPAPAVVSAVTRHTEVRRAQEVPPLSRKPSPAITKFDPSSLPIVTDPIPTASTASAQSRVQAPPPVATANPAATLPTHAVNTAPASSVSVASNQPSAAPVAAPLKPRKISVPYGTILSVRMLDTVSSDQNQAGDKFTASLASPVMVDDKVVIPAEAGLRGKVVEVESGGRFGGKPSLAIELEELSYNGENYTISTNQFSKQGTSRSVKAAETVGGGAGVGAILGAIVGGGRGAAIGAAIGAGIGTGVQAKGKGSEVQLPSESVLSFRLKSPISIQPADTLLRAPNSTQDASADPFPNDRPVLKRRPGAGADPMPPPDQPPVATGPDNSQPPVDSTDPTNSTDPNGDSRPVLKRRPN